MSSTPAVGMGAGGALAAGWRAVQEHRGASALFIAIYAALSVPLHFVGETVESGPGMAQSQEALVQLILTQFGAFMAVTAVMGPIFAAVGVYIARKTSAGEQGTAYGALNYALARYGRLFLWCLAVQFSVQIGLQLVVLPGILFFQMYAFVPAVICAENEPWPMARSKKLTQGRRRTIFLMFLPWLMIYMGFGMLDFFGKVQEWVGLVVGTADPSRNTMAVAWFFIESLRFLYELCMGAGLYALYEERIARIQAAREARAAAAATGQPG